MIDSDADQITAAPDCLVQTPLALAPSIDVFSLVDTVGISNVVLMKITITRFTNLGRTSIGVNASHCIGKRFDLLSSKQVDVLIGGFSPQLIRQHTSSS